MMTVPDRVTLMLEKLALNQSEFARLAGTSKGMVNHWLTGNVKSIAPRYAYNIESNSLFNARWILTGEGPAQREQQNTSAQTEGSSPDSPYPNISDTPINSALSRDKTAHYRVTTAQPIRHHLPVISWGDALMVRDRYESGAVLDMPQVAYADDVAGRRLVVLIQDDDSMTAASVAPSFPPGTEYVVDIDRAPVPGDYVLVPGADRAFLRQLVSDATGRKLRPLNPQFDPVPYNDVWLGTLIDAKLPLFKAKPPPET